MQLTSKTIYFEELNRHLTLLNLDTLEIPQRNLLIELAKSNSYTYWTWLTMVNRWQVADPVHIKMSF